MNDKFYCYSTRMSYFIRSFNIKYVETGFNAKSRMKYHVFEKSERLDKIISLYNEVKYTI
jgi:hypothetical protein